MSPFGVCPLLVSIYNALIFAIQTLWTSVVGVGGSASEADQAKRNGVRHN